VDTTELIPGVIAVLAVIGGAAGVVLLRRVRRRRAEGLPQRTPATPAMQGAGAQLRSVLAATSRRFRAQLEAILRREGQPVEQVVHEVEEALIAADVGLPTAQALVSRVRQTLEVPLERDALWMALQREAAALLSTGPPPVPTVRPWVVLVTGVNGVGKTTTIGKLAARHIAEGRKVLLVAADTFRAAASDQLAVWAERVGADLVRHTPGGDPGAVVFDGLKAALARRVDVVLVDTAGRLHTRTPLMEELRKLRRVVEREIAGAPHETLLVLDATTGQNAITQARLFTEAVQVTGIVLTKLDGTARGGVVLAIRHQLGIPIRFIGIGEKIEDLRPFDPDEFANALFGGGGDAAEAGGAAAVVPVDGPSP